MTWQLCVRGAVLFCGQTHPEATAATRWTSFELASEMRLFPVLGVELSQKGHYLSCVSCRALLVVLGRKLASVMTWQRCVRGAVLFCGLTHPEATAATRWTSFELASEMRLLPIPAADLSFKGICLSCVSCRALLVMQGRKLASVMIGKLCV